jgi:hypothetical protein
MKRLMVTLSSLALVGVACGQVTQNGEDELGGTTSGAPGSGPITGSGGTSSSSTPKPTGSGGKSTGTGGKSTGAGGKVSGFAGTTTVGPFIGGAPSSGGTFSLGGDEGFGGAVEGVGGAPDADEACSLYCAGYTKVCPQAGFGTFEQCTQDCAASLALDNAACSAGKRIAYECIGNALVQAPGSCNLGLAIAQKECGSATPQVDACNATCVASSVYGDGTGCHASAECKGFEVDLNCLDVNSGNVPCTCSIGGKKRWEIATGFPYSKAGCIDDALFRLCADELP